MYAIIESGGKQYKVSEGTKLRVERLSVKEGEEIQIREVLAFKRGEKIITGDPFVSNVYVIGKVLGEGKAKKVIVFRFKRRKDYKKKRGHRQPYTELLIEKIVMEGENGT